MTTITPNQLRKGDLLFPYTGDKTGTVGMAGGAAGHVTIITHSDYAGIAHEAHVIAGDTVIKRDGKKQRDYWVGLATTDVKVNAPPKDEGDSPMIRVLRCKRGELANRAAFYASLWDKSFLLPYAIIRSQIASSVEAKYRGNGAALVAEQRKLFRDYAKYRAIKYTARREGFACYPGEQEQGMFCSMFVAICFQVAGLETLVSSVSKDLSLRVSDKKMSASDIKSLSEHFEGKTSDLKSYKKYVKHLRAVNPYKIAENPLKTKQKGYRANKLEGVSYIPSVMCWRSSNFMTIENCPWEKYITKGMMLDPKVIYPTGLASCLLDDDDDWKDMGYLVGQAEFSETLDQKGARLDHKHDTAKARRAEMGLPAHGRAGFPLKK